MALCAARRRRAAGLVAAVDDEFAQTQFHAPPLNSLRVTAAHEFFHAVQFAYDFGEDRWLMEGSAAGIEDEVYDGVDDNYQYLRGGPLPPRTGPSTRASTTRGSSCGSWPSTSARPRPTGRA